MKKVALSVLAAVVLLVGGAAVVFLVNPLGLGSRIGEYVAAQTVRIGQTYLEPTIGYDSFDYEPPGRLTMNGFTLTSTDGTEVVSATSATIELAEVPRRGRPIVIEAITLVDPQLRLVQTYDEQGDPSGFKGLVPMLKRENVAEQEQVEEEVKLSNVFRLRRLAIDNGGFVYDLNDGSDPMELRDITLETGVDPVGPGDEYALDIDLDRSPIFEVALEGALNIDTFRLPLDTFRMKVDLAEEESIAVLPPQLQSIFKEYDAKGAMEIEASGEVALRDPFKSILSGALTIAGLNVAVDEYRMPVEQADVSFSMSGGVLRNNATLDMLDGTLKLTETTLDLNKNRTDITWDAQGLMLQELLRAQPEAGKAPELAGVLSSSGSASTSLEQPTVQMSGSGQVDLREGRLVRIPLVSRLAKVMDVSGYFGEPKLLDTFEATFDLTSEGVDCSDLKLKTPAFVARGKGVVGYDGSLDLRLNAGPLERLQESVPVLGDLMGAVTDRLMKYGVKGSMTDPKISVKPLGL